MYERYACRPARPGAARLRGLAAGPARSPFGEPGAEPVKRLAGLIATGDEIAGTFNDAEGAAVPCKFPRRARAR